MSEIDGTPLTEAEIGELPLAHILASLGLILRPYTYQGTARHVLNGLRKDGYVLTDYIPPVKPLQPPVPVYAIIDATGRDTGWTVIGKKQVPPPWLDETCPECGVKWRYPSPQCPHMILDRHPKG